MVSYLENRLLEAQQAFEEARYDEGRQWIDHVLAEEPACAAAHLALGKYYLHLLREPREARPCLERALQFDPDSPEAMLHMAVLLLSEGAFAEAENYTTGRLEHAGLYRFAMGCCHAQAVEWQGRYRQARRRYRDAMRFAADEEEMNAVQESLQRCRRKAWSEGLARLGWG
jgi:tetratricopeptide (TPR) repeat protein